MTRCILMLEDNEERIASFRKIVLQLGMDLELKVWRDAPSMIAECAAFFADSALITLDHDLNPMPGALADPGTGLEVACFLADFLPACPVIIHSSNTDRAWSMHNELRFSGWIVERVGPLGSDWIETSWLRAARGLLRSFPNTWDACLPSDHATRVERMHLSLLGLGLGDALGEMLSHGAHQAVQRLSEGELPSGPWFHTDDTEMAISITSILNSHGHVQQDGLAKRFARRFERDPDRGYGKMTRIQLREAIAGGSWRALAAEAFGGQGSMGNGGAMRVAPLGAYFADELERCAEEARLSAIVTHTHAEGIAGTIAVAVAAACAQRLQQGSKADRLKEFFDAILSHTPESQVRRKLLIAAGTGNDVAPEVAARQLGNGTLVTAQDTVPFCIWMAAHHADSFVRALGNTINVGGDCDTNAAIVGGIVALSAGRGSIPQEWIDAREVVRV